SGFACAISAGDGLYCWGEEPVGGPEEIQVFNIPEIDDQPLRQVAAGATHVCALDRNGKAECWGRLSGGTTEPRETGGTKLAGGRTFSCAINGLGHLRCWGSPTFGLQVQPPQSVRFTDVAASPTHACAIYADDETVVCWGDDAKGQSTPPPGL